MKECGLRKWKQEMSGKGTLKWYLNKAKPRFERIYDGSYVQTTKVARANNRESTSSTKKYNIG